MLKFSKGNKYLGKDVWTFNLPSGWSCPYAEKCLAKTDRQTGKLIKGPSMEYKCYSAAGERYPAVRNAVWHNYEALLGLPADQVASLIFESMPKSALKVRIHGGGDFFSQAYLDGWIEAIFAMPNAQFWAFTKSLPLFKKHQGALPENFVVTASIGGTRDAMAEQLGIRTATVFSSAEKAYESDMLIDNADMLAREHGPSFALVDNFAKTGER